MQTFPPGTTVIERKRKPDGTDRAFRCELLASSPHFALVLFVVERPSAFHAPLLLPRGTRSYGFFWSDRPYNAYRMVGADGRVVAHRFDALCDVRITSAEVSYRDLVLDWWVLADGTLVEEDRDEYDELVEAGVLSAADTALVEAAAAEIVDNHAALMSELALVQRQLVRHQA